MADSLLPDDNNQNVEQDREALLAKWKDKSPEEVLKAKVESDLYIKSLTTRLDDLRNDYLSLREQREASENLKSLIDQFKSKTQNDDTDPDTNKGQVQAAAIKTEDIEALVAKQLSAHQLAMKQQENLNAIQSKLKEQFGDNYPSVYKQRLDSLGLTKEFADDLARNHPSVFIKTFELDRTETRSPSLPRSSVRQPTFAPTSAKRDWNYYQELKKNDPRMYLDPKIAIQMHNDMMELGSDFGMPED